MTNSVYYTVITAFAIAAYFILTDENAARMVYLRLAELSINVRRYWFILTRWPRIRYDMWRIQQRVKQIRKEAPIKNWKDVGGGDHMIMGLIGQKFWFLRGSKDKLKEVKQKMPRKSFLYLTDEEKLLWHTEDGRLFETKFMEIKL